MVKWDTITHDFPGSSIDGTFWPGSYGATPTVASNVLDWSASSGTYSGRATTGYDLTDSSLSFKVDTIPSGGFGGGTIKADASNVDIFELQVRPGTGVIRCKYYGENWGGSADSTNVATAPQSPTFFRITLASSTATAEYSFDGTSWTTIDTYTVSGSALTALADCKLELNCGPFPSAMSAGPKFAKINLLPASGSDVEGTASATWPTWSATAAGTVGVEGDAAASWPSWSGTASGTVGVEGVASAAWPSWAATASGTVGVEGVASASWPAWSATAAGDVAHDGQAAATWPSWAATAQGDVEVTGQATAAWPSWSGTAAGDVAHDGQATASWPGWSATADGTVGVEGDASTAWPSWSASAQGEVDVTGQATASWPTWVGTATGSGQGAGEGQATASWPGWSATAAGEIAHDGTASASWPAWSSTASGVTGKAGTATAAWPSWTAAASGVTGKAGTATASWPTWVGTATVVSDDAVTRRVHVTLGARSSISVVVGGESETRVAGADTGRVLVRLNDG